MLKCGSPQLVAFDGMWEGKDSALFKAQAMERVWTCSSEYIYETQVGLIFIILLFLTFFVGGGHSGGGSRNGRTEKWVWW